MTPVANEAIVSLFIDKNPRIPQTAGMKRKTPPATDAAQLGPFVSFSTRVGQLYRKHQELIRPVVENPRDFVLLSLRDMAKKLNTDPATTVRMVRGLGFHNFREFRAYLQEIAIAYATSLEVMEASGSAESDLVTEMRRCMDQDLRNVNRLRNSVDLERIAKLAERIYSARRVLIVGGDLATSLVQFLEHHLLILDLPVFSATASARSFYLTRSAGKKDLTIGISYGRCLKMTVEALQKARSNGAHTVGITDTFVSPLAQFADESFLTSVETRSFASSYVAPMCFLNTLIIACANYRRGRTISLMKQVSLEERRGTRWYQ